MKYFWKGFLKGFTDMSWTLRGVIVVVLCYILWRELT